MYAALLREADPLHGPVLLWCMLSGTHFSRHGAKTMWRTHFHVLPLRALTYSWQNSVIKSVDGLWVLACIVMSVAYASPNINTGGSKWTVVDLQALRCKTSDCWLQTSFFYYYLYSVNKLVPYIWFIAHSKLNISDFLKTGMTPWFMKHKKVELMLIMKLFKLIWGNRKDFVTNVNMNVVFMIKW